MQSTIDLTHLVTESRNPNSEQIDNLSTLDMLKVINNEDKKVAFAIEQQLEPIAQAVEAISHAFKHGGRLIYCGAGTSGRLGILDASECPPTYGTKPEMVMGLIAGGHTAIFKAVENAEDNQQLCIDDLNVIDFNQRDVLVGIAASGRTPYVIGGLEYANQLGATTVTVSCNPHSEIARIAKIAITPVVGPEVVTGSSRMKAGTAQKLVLNMLTTGAMIKMGKVYGNLMVDVEATNQKLIERQINIVMQATDCDHHQAEQALSQCQRHCKTAIVMILGHLNAKDAKALLDQNGGFIRQAIKP